MDVSPLHPHSLGPTQYTDYILQHTFVLGLTGVNLPLPEVAFSGEQELLIAPDDLFMRKKQAVRR